MNKSPKHSKCKSWHVEWNGPDREPCLVTSHASAKDAKKKAGKYFSIYSPNTIYNLIKVVEYRTEIERFKAKLDKLSPIE